MIKKEAGEQKERKQAIDFGKSECCPSFLVQRVAVPKNVWFGESGGIWDPQKAYQLF